MNDDFTNVLQHQNYEWDWNYYKSGNWYCKTNIRLPEPRDVTMDEISAFFPSDTFVLLEEYIASYDDLYNTDEGDLRDRTG